MASESLLSRKLTGPANAPDLASVRLEDLHLDAHMLRALHLALAPGAAPLGGGDSDPAAAESDGAARPVMLVGPELIESLELVAAGGPVVGPAAEADQGGEAGAMVLVFMRGSRTESGIQPGQLVAYFDPDPNGSTMSSLFAQPGLQKPLELSAAPAGELPAMPSGWVQTVMTPWVEGLLVRPGSVLELANGDFEVSAGEQLSVSASTLGAGQALRFDGSGETDGSFRISGGDGADEISGGHGADFIDGGRGADALTGGPGGDVFGYLDARDSSGAAHDRLLDFDPAADRIDLPVTVSGIDPAVQGGALSSDSFDGDLAAALAGLGAGRAVLFAPDAGDLAGSVFLVVDGNGAAGYQPGEDFVFALPGAGPADLDLSPAIFV